MVSIKYSIIIPHKNCPDLLDRCINSIPKRNDIQIIVVDDNSDERKKPKSIMGIDFIYLDSNKSKGAGKARNIGLKHAKGQWLLFADADDYYRSDFIDILDNALTDDIDVLYFNIFTYSKEFNRAKQINDYYSAYINTKNESIIKYKIWAPWNKVISSRLIAEHNLLFDEIPVGNDAIFSLHASLYAQNIKIIQDKLYCLTYQPNSITYKPMTFERRLAYARINIRINIFFINHKLENFQTVIFTPRVIFQVWKENGIKGLNTYITYVHNNYSISRALIIWIKEKFLL